LSAALAVLVVANIGTTCAEFGGIAAGFELFGISRYASVPAAPVIVSLLVLRGSFHRVEHFRCCRRSGRNAGGCTTERQSKHRGCRP
jgi:Mn2+/Fe2+ NRAMP family transporter